MATMNISLPNPMRDWVQSQIEAGKYSSSSDYVRDLIRQDQAKREQQQILQQAITDGLKSGVSDRSMDELLEDARSRLAALNAG
jgi:antitoxin ParD1/3/4